MPLVHLEEFVGDDAARWLSFAHSELRKWDWFDDPGAMKLKHIPVEGGYVRLRQIGATTHDDKIQYININVGGSYFEFLTSGKPVETVTTVGTLIPFTAYKAAVVSVGVFEKSSTASIAKGAKSENTIPNSPLGRPAQVGLTDEPVAYPGAKGLIYESFAPMSPHTGVWLRSWGDVNTWADPYDHAAREPWADRGPVSPWTVRDIDFDIPFQSGVGKTKAKRAYLRGDADWPRANALYTATSAEFGSRQFAIYNDAFGQFWFFPTGSITAELPSYAQNVDASVVKMVKPTLPDWCFVSALKAMEHWDAEGEKSLVDFPDTDWKFSHDGTKACAVVFERRAATRDTYFDANVGATPLNSTRFNSFRDYYTGPLGKYGATFFPNYNVGRYSIAPGVVELRFAITLTGSEPSQYTVAVTVNEIRRPTTSEYFTVLAGYSWVDVKAPNWTAQNQNYEARKGDMVVLDLERHYKVTSISPGFSFGIKPHFLSLKNLTRATELRAFPAARNIPALHGIETSAASRTYVQWYNLVDFDLQTLSFVLRIQFKADETRTVPTLTTGTATETYTVYHFGLSVYTLNRFRETLYPETISDYARTELDARKQISGRDAIDDTYTRLPLNLMDGWSNPTYSGFRDWFMEQQFTKDFSPNATVPSNATLALFEVGINPAIAPTTLRGPCYLTDPCFGWNSYAQVFFQINHLTEFSSFFVHPSGTWAVYDQQYVYNRTGTPNGPISDITITKNTFDTLDPLTFEHVIFDRVHFKNQDTTFRALYNKAVAAGVAAGTLVANLQPIELTDLRATFAINSIVSSGVTAAMIRVDWGGKTGYYLEGSYMKYAGNTTLRFGNRLGWQVPNLGDYFFEDAAGNGRTNFFSATPIKFSSAVQA